MSSNGPLDSIKNNGKGMLEEGAIYAAGGALVGLILDKLLTKSTDTTTVSYGYTKIGTLVGAVVGASAAANTNAITTAISTK